MKSWILEVGVLALGWGPTPFLAWETKWLLITWAWAVMSFVKFIMEALNFTLVISLPKKGSWGVSGSWGSCRGTSSFFSSRPTTWTWSTRGGILSLAIPSSTLLEVDVLVFKSYKNKDNRLREDTLYNSTLRHNIRIVKKVKLLSSYSILSMDVFTTHTNDEDTTRCGLWVH